MPLYEYQCKKCKHRFEKIQSFSDAPIKKCPSCGANAVEKLLSAPAVHFKGSGFYVTDYAKKSSPDSSSSERASGEKSESKGSGKDGAPSSDSGSADKTASATKSSGKSSSESKSAPAEPKGDPRGRSSHSKKSSKR